MSTNLRTSRLQLNLFSPEDSEELHEIYSDPLTHTIGDGPYSNIEQTQGWIARRLATYTRTGLAWYAVRLANGELIGTAGLTIHRIPDAPEIGYEVRAAHQRSGFATEAARVVLTEGARVGLPSVWATVRPRNAASLAVLSKLGFAKVRSEPDAKGPLDFLRVELTDWRNQPAEEDETRGPLRPRESCF